MFQSLKDIVEHKEFLLSKTFEDLESFSNCKKSELLNTVSTFKKKTGRQATAAVGNSLGLLSRRVGADRPGASFSKVPKRFR